MISRKQIGSGVVVLGAVMWPIAAQERPVPHSKQEYSLDPGRYDGDANRVVLKSIARVEVPGATWLRLFFSAANLGRHSYLTVTSVADGGQQRLDTQSLGQWQNSSAVFNGDAVDIDLFVAPGEKQITYRIENILVGAVAHDGPDVLKSLCGSDNRSASTDGRVGRLFTTGCTVWLTSSGALLTAGHCVDASTALDANGCCTLCPDGVADTTFLNDIVEFNVPASMPNGTLVAADPNDQYPIIGNSVVHNFDGECQGLGKDWAVFGCGANANTGLLPSQAQGDFFRMTREAPAANTSIRITGCGIDNTPPGSSGGFNAQTQTNQTDTGLYTGEMDQNPDFLHQYAVDTTGGNSGSPIIWDSTGFTIGIHTNAGCTAVGGANQGTSFEHDPLEAALEQFPGPDAVFVDTVSLAPAENGTVFEPFDTVAEAVSAVPAGGIVSIVTGSFPGAMTITKALTLSAPVGAVTIGQ